MACLGPPPPPPPRGKRGWRGGEAAASSEASPLAFVALGTSCALYQAGPALEELLRPWAGDRCITIDRFDVRNLLEPTWVPPAAGRGWCARGAEEEGVLPAVLEAERYADLHTLEDAERDAKRQRREEPPQSPPLPPQPDAAAPFAAVPFAYAAEPPPPPPEEPYEPPFDIPERFSAPSSRPRSAREGAVVARTAAFVRSSGPQAEIVLRVRHAAAPAFAFLQPGHPLHAFFRFMVDTDPEARAAQARRTLALLSAYEDAETEGAEGGAEGGAEAAERARDAADAAAVAPAEAVPLAADATLDAASAEPSAAEAAAPAAPAPPPRPASEASAETVSVMDKLVAFVMKNGPEFEATLRRRQGASPAFAFLQPWSPLNALYVAKLAAARAAAEAEKAAAEKAAAAAAPPKPRRLRWDVAAPPASAPVVTMPPPPQQQPPAPAATEREPTAEEAAAAAAAAAEEERRLERLRRAREFSAKRAADARTAAVTAHASRASAHRSVFSMDDDDDLLLPDCDAPPPAPLPPPPALVRRVEPRAAVGASLADAHAAALTAAARAARVAPAPPRTFPPHS